MENETRLKVFATAAVAKSITRAADILTISQPAVSRHIKLLEAEIGCPLFRRHGRGIELTDNGQRLFDVVSPALNRINATIGQLQLSAKSVAGQLRIASVHSVNSYYIMPRLKDVLDINPNITVQILEQSSLDVGISVERGLADIGLAYDSMIASQDLHIVRLHDECMQLIHSAQDEIKLSAHLNKDGAFELGPDLNFVVLSAGYALRRMMDLRLGQNMRHTIQVETINLMLEAVRAGLGVCVLPKNMPHHMIEGKGLIRKEIAPPEMSRTVVAIARPESLNVPIIAHMMEEFVKAANQLSNNQSL